MAVGSRCYAKCSSGCLLLLFVLTDNLGCLIVSGCFLDDTSVVYSLSCLDIIILHSCLSLSPSSEVYLLHFLQVFTFHIIFPYPPLPLLIFSSVLFPPVRLQGYRILRSHDHQPIPSPAPPDVLLPSRRCLTSAV